MTEKACFRDFGAATVAVDAFIKDRIPYERYAYERFHFTDFLRYEIFISYGEKCGCAASKMFFILRIFVSYRKITRVSYCFY